MTSSNHSSTPPSSPPLSSPPTNSLSDIFSDSPPNSPTSSHHHPAEPSDIPRLRGIHVTEGYREGIDAAKKEAAQPGFDEAYPLGAILGLRVGYVLGILQGLCGAYGVKSSPQKADGEVEIEDGENFRREEGHRLRELSVQARAELKIETLFGKDYWRSDGIWAYDVQSQAGEEKVTFWEVADQHPAIRKWLKTVRDEIRKAGVQSAEDRFAGVGQGDRENRLENLLESMQVVETGDEG
ncbi:MAG: hypothetical protein Q9166_004563 [cf. Caloplaca sp. 2 TL-2023]